MNIKDSVGKYLSYSEGDYYDDADSMDYDYDEAQDEEYQDIAPEKPARASKKNFFGSILSRAMNGSSKRQQDVDYDDDYGYGYGDDEENYYEQPAQKSSDNVVDFSSKSRNSNAKVILAKPSMFDIETARDIARHINQQRLVLLNMEQVGDSDVRRMIDFLSGVVFANNGKISCISNKTFIMLPHNYDFSGDILENIKSGYYSI